MHLMGGRRPCVDPPHVVGCPLGACPTSLAEDSNWLTNQRAELWPVAISDSRCAISSIP